MQAPQEVGLDEARLARKLAEVVSDPVLHITHLVKAARVQRLDPILRGRASEGGTSGVPPGSDLHIWRQAGVDQALRVGDRPFIELRDPSRERLNVGVQVGIR